MNEDFQWLSCRKCACTPDDKFLYIIVEVALWKGKRIKRIESWEILSTRTSIGVLAIFGFDCPFGAAYVVPNWELNFF
jgi:hypothetical protein